MKRSMLLATLFAICSLPALVSADTAPGNPTPMRELTAKSVIGHVDPANKDLVFNDGTVVRRSTVQSVSAAEHQTRIRQLFGAKPPSEKTFKMARKPPQFLPVSVTRRGRGFGGSSSGAGSGGACVPSCWTISEGGASCSGCCVPVGPDACSCWESCTDTAGARSGTPQR